MHRDDADNALMSEIVFVIFDRASLHTSVTIDEEIREIGLKGLFLGRGLDTTVRTLPAFTLGVCLEGEIGLFVYIHEMKK